MAEALLKVLANNIYSMIQQEVGMLWGIENEMQKLASLFTTIQAVMKDAEEKQFKDLVVRNWLQKLTVAAHEVDDILDDIVLESNKIKHGGSMSSFSSRGNILFCHKTGKRMKDITRKLDAIAEERTKFHLNESPARQDRVDLNELRETSSIMSKLEVFGRDKEKDKIVEILVNQIRDTQNTSVLPIVGVGGLGKTTLAQLVFNDQRITKYFALRLWVCVSDDFNVKRLTKAIIESASRTASEALDLDPLQRVLQEILKGKRYLLVLDDVWNDDQEKWEKLKCVLSCGSRGSAIVTTTRMEKVASIMGTLPSHYLTSLSEDDCWSLFRQRAFGLEVEEHPNLVAIGKEIVKKCSGVPLAVKALGGLLRFKRAENEWLFVKESELWNLPQDEMSILPALRLSYHNLPVELRHCFTYCAIYPKDTWIKKHEVILSWIANGFISSDGRLDLEDAADAIWNELYWRSFFQDARDHSMAYIFKMHDLVHDLAESVMEGKYPSQEFQSSGYRSESTIRHMQLTQENKILVAFPKRVMDASSITPKFGSVRAFVAATPDCTTGLLSSAIANMKHLRYMDLSHGSFSALPNSICDLWNLQALRLNYCMNLRSLPKHMRRLRNLRHLCLEHTLRLNCMPKKIGQLTCLKSLSKFMVGTKKGYQISELGDLQLEGPLLLGNLELVESKEDSEQVKLNDKKNLRILHLSWGLRRRRPKQKNDQQVLEALRPHSNLQQLVIVRFGGLSFPRWMSEVSTLKNIREIGISSCVYCTHLPKLGLLPNLQRLHISRSPAEYIDESHDGDNITQFPSLSHLTIREMPLLKGLSRSGVQGRVIFPSLQILDILDCPSFSFCENAEFCSISNLGVEDADELTSSPKEKQRNPNDDQASVTASKEMCPEPSSEGGLKEQTSSFRASNSGFQSSESEIHQTVEFEYLMSLRRLQLRKLGWVVLPEGLQHIHMLQNLELEYLPYLTSLPDWLGELTFLQSLKIRSCPMLQSLPDSIQRMNCLQCLIIEFCPGLGHRLVEKEGEDWHKIKHIPTRSISNNYSAGGFSETFTSFDYTVAELNMLSSM